MSGPHIVFAADLDAAVTVPQDADLVGYGPPDSDWDTMVDRMDDATDAVVGTRPVTDALKAVANGLVHAGIDRSHLVHATVPLLVRAEAARGHVGEPLAALVRHLTAGGRVAGI